MEPIRRTRESSGRIRPKEGLHVERHECEEGRGDAASEVAPCEAWPSDVPPAKSCEQESASLSSTQLLRSSRWSA
jgi:hypothetical protein